MKGAASDRGEERGRDREGQISVRRVVARLLVVERHQVGAALLRELLGVTGVQVVAGGGRPEQQDSGDVGAVDALVAVGVALDDIQLGEVFLQLGAGHGAVARHHHADFSVVVQAAVLSAAATAATIMVVFMDVPSRD